MRISGGKARGIMLTTGRASHVRPATDRMREAVFSSLGDVVAGASVLDLFAGSGSYGLEALSRGAQSVLFVEKHPQAAAALQQNLAAVLKSMGDPGNIRTKVIRRDVLRFNSSLHYDIIFMDPPYDLARERGTELLNMAGNLLVAGGVLAYELPGELPMAGDHWERVKRIGKSTINEPSVTFLRRTDQ